VPIAAALLLFFSFGIDYPRDFPEPMYPVSLVRRHADEIAQARVPTTDSWGHYLTFRYPPPFQIFIDGRCDFFGERFTNEYLSTLNGVPGWDDILRRYRVEMVLVPPRPAWQSGFFINPAGGWSKTPAQPRSSHSIRSSAGFSLPPPWRRTAAVSHHYRL